MKKKVDILDWDDLPSKIKHKWIDRAQRLDWEKIEKLNRHYANLPEGEKNKQFWQSSEAWRLIVEQKGKDLFYKEHQNKAYIISQYLYSNQENSRKICDNLKAKACIDGTPIAGLYDEIKRLQKEVIDLPMGISWHSASMPTTMQIEALEEWFGDDEFWNFLGKLQLMDLLAIEANRLKEIEAGNEATQYAKEKRERLINKWLLVEGDKNIFIKRIRPQIKGAKGKGLYTAILALERNKQLRSVAYGERSELFSLLEFLFDDCGTLKSLNDAIMEFENNGNLYIADKDINTLCEIFR